MLKTVFINPQNLGVGKTYTVSRQTPLMPCPTPDAPSEVFEAIAQMKQIPAKGWFKVVAVRRLSERDPYPWYEVAAYGPEHELIGDGWIFANALIGQNLCLNA